MKLLAYPKLWWDVGTSSSITSNGLDLNIGITFFRNLDIFGNIFGFLIFFVKNSNFHIQTTSISKIVVGCWYLLLYHFKWTISKHWNHIFHESRYFWQYFWTFRIFCEKNRIFAPEQLAYPKLWWDVGTSSSITSNGLDLNIGITFFRNLDIFGNIFGFFLFLVKKSNFHTEATGISKVTVRCWHLLFYQLKWTISKHWNHIFHQSRYFWQ